jgi:CubicO group peptidase (beta-lactamase class C family)
LSAALYLDDAVVAASCGVTNVVSGVQMTTDAIMHIGSITKIFNATLLMQLVDAGVVSLARPVIEYLPELRLRDRKALRKITVEQLVNHTSGIDGNLLPDAGHDEETLDLTIERFADFGQLHLPGAARSYCNAGTVIAGYLCQRMTGKSWYDLVKDRIFRPLGLNHAVVLPEDALLYRSSIGHFIDGTTGVPRRTSKAFLSLGFAPAGSTAMMSAKDLLTFVRMHLEGGVGPDGTRIITNDSAVSMRRISGNIAGPSCFDCGISWMLLPGGLVHHGGGGPGILSWFVAHPPTRTIAVVMTNADNGFMAVNEVIGPIIETHLGLTPFPAAVRIATDPDADLSPYVGSYENNTVIYRITARDGRLHWSAQAKAMYADASPLEEQPPVPLVPAEDGLFLTDAQGVDKNYAGRITMRFAAPVNGKMEYLIQSYRMHRRCE